MKYEETPDKVETKNYSLKKEATSYGSKNSKDKHDFKILDESAKLIVDVLTKNGASFSGPIPLPTDKEIITILRSPHVNKDSREQFEQRTHKRIIDVYTPSAQIVEAIGKLDMPAGVSIEVKIK